MRRAGHITLRIIRQTENIGTVKTKRIYYSQMRQAMKVLILQDQKPAQRISQGRQ